MGFGDGIRDSGDSVGDSVTGDSVADEGDRTKGTDYGNGRDGP